MKFAKKLFRLICTSAALVAILAVLSVFYALYLHGALSAAYVFTANFAGGAFFFLVGFILLLTPTALFLLKKDNLIDHTTYAQRFMEKREEKNGRAYELMYVGILNIVITGVVQLLLSYLVN